MLQLGILSSHNGTNFQAIADACTQGRLAASVAVLIGNNSQAKVVERAQKLGVPFVHLSGKTHSSPEALDAAMNKVLRDAGVELVVLAGYMKKLGPEVLSEYRNRIINVHPSLLPRYGGAGYFGDRVHAAVLESGDSESGATVHLVNEAYDEGAIILQERITVTDSDTVTTLSDRIRPLEHRLLIQAIEQFARQGTFMEKRGSE